MTVIGTAFASLMLRLGMSVAKHRHWGPFQRATRRPEDSQMGLLKTILRENATTSFGREHGFSSIQSYEEYRHRVPVQTYETLRSLVDRQARSGEPCLTRARPVLYARTSGTAGKPKDIPMTADGIKRFADIQKIFAYGLYTNSGLFDGKIFAVGSPAIEGYLECGVPYGSTTGMIYKRMPRIVQAKYVLPAEVFEIEDFDVRYYVLAALGLRECDVSGLVTANPSTFLKILTIVRDQWQPLIEDIERGNLRVSDRLPRDQAAAIGRRFRKDPKRARELRQLGSSGRAISFADIWPGLKAVVTWTGGSCGFALSELRPLLPTTAKVIEVGYVASEFRGTVTVDFERGHCVPTLNANFFEFVERNDWENDRPNFLTLTQLRQGRQYYVFVTTRDGLYRYDINDIVEVTGFFHATPTFAFIQKGKGVTNITGEKLSEEQILKAMSFAQDRIGVSVGFFLAMADEARPGYDIFVEPTSGEMNPEALADEIDRQLKSLNVEYEAKRASARLGPVRCCSVRPGTGEDYRRYCVRRGQREAQFKTLLIQYKSACHYDFAARCVTDTSP